MPPRPAVLFDLDGTLTDPYDGIARSYARAAEALGRPLPASFDYRACIGPPIRDVFATIFGSDPAVIAAAVAAYRERYASVGLFENRVYAGIPAALARLGGTFRLFVCTTKPQPFAARILERFDLAGAFERVYGAELDGTRDDKRALLAYLLERESLAPATTVLIGDRRYDVAAARANGVATAGVTWGYGSPGELRDAGCVRTFAHPDEITADAIDALLASTAR